MVELALAGMNGLAASDLERSAAAPSFTVETLRRLHAEHEALDLWLVLGGDSLEDVPAWREPEEIGRLARLAVYPRPGFDSLGGEGRARPPIVARWEEAGRVRRLAGPPLDLSSSEIRRRAALGRSLRFLVPESVRGYILEQGLYRQRSAPSAEA
jgi:nicotinate-nucleotide adenylyltransferase